MGHPVQRHPQRFGPGLPEADPLHQVGAGGGLRLQLQLQPGVVYDQSRDLVKFICKARLNINARAERNINETRTFQPLFAEEGDRIHILLFIILFS